MTDENKDAAHWDAVDEAAELLHEERFHEALVALRDVIKRDPGNPYAYYLLGVGLFDVGEVEPARDAYLACLRLAPRHLGARVALSHVLRGMGDVRGAIREGAEALSQSPGDADALHAVGLAYYARGDGVAARKYLDAFLAARPEPELADQVRELIERIEGERA